MFPFISRGSFYGGIFLPSAKALTENRLIEPMALPESLRIPLPPQSQPIIAPGTRVGPGERLARASSGTLDTFSPVAGKVLRQTVVDTPYHRQVQALEFEVHDETCARPAANPNLLENWDDLSAEHITNTLAQCALIGQGGKGRPTASKISEARQRGVRHIIINGMESEPCLTADHRILSEHAGELINTMLCLRKYLDARHCWIAVDESHRQIMRQLYELGRPHSIRVAGLKNRYPQGFAPLLIQALLDLEVPAGLQPIDVGALVLNVGTLFHAGRAIAENIPLTARVVTVSGDAVGRPGNYWIPVGTTVGHLLQTVGQRATVDRVVVGGPMTGRVISHYDVVLTARCQALLAFTARTIDRMSPTACIHCGWCLEVCPVQLEPAQLYKSIELETDQRTRRLHVSECIECGLCSYVCPSSLPLSSAITAAKHRMAAAS